MKKVKILDFNRRKSQISEMEEQLEEVLNEGYEIVSQSECNGILSFTAVKEFLGVQTVVEGDPLPTYAPSRTGDPLCWLLGSDRTTKKEILQ